MIIIIKFLTILICAVLNVWGGYSWKIARRFIMPTIIAIAVSVILHSWWIGLICLPSIAILCMGYGEKSFLEHIFNDAWGRFVWMVLVSMSFCLGLIILHHLNIYIALAYSIGNGILGMTLRKYNQIITDAIFGIGLASFIFYIV